MPCHQAKNLGCQRVRQTLNCFSGGVGVSYLEDGLKVITELLPKSRKKNLYKNSSLKLTWGPFTNHVVLNLGFFDPHPPCSHFLNS